MGKIKTVVMGDIEAEETARKKAEVKREQKKLAQEPASAEASAGKEEKKKTKKAENKYRFPRGRRYNDVRTLVDRKKLYPLSEAVDLAKKTSHSKFDGSIEVHYNVTDKNLRGIVTLPHGTGKKIKVAIATEDLIKLLETSPKIDFDILVASPDMMGKLAKIAKILGPKGLMPNPKTGTIGDDPERLALSLAKGQTQWKTQPDFPIIHAVIGKVSFEPKKLEENFSALTKSIGSEKIKSAYLKATMGPSVKVAL